MNTPRTKKPKRYKFEIPKNSPRIPDGKYSSGIADETLSMYFAAIATQWPHTEEAMVEILRELCGDAGPVTKFPARVIFRSIVSQQGRINTMRSLLECTNTNKDKSSDYDEIIDEFASLNGQRNKFLHGLWWTHENGRVFFEEATVDGKYLTQREVKKKELEALLNRMSKLNRRIYLDRKKRASLESNLPQPGDTTQ